jgi:hypothetical protein
MPSPAGAGTNTVELGKRHITDQSLRIQRLRRLIARLERDSQFDLVPDAVRHLVQMEQSLARMEADYSVARERSAIRRLFDLR